MDAQGALESLLGRLTAVLVSEAQLLGRVRGDVEFIKDEMESMGCVVARIMEAQPQHRDSQVRTWIRHVAGLAHDSEACVDLYLLYVGHRGKGLLPYLRRIPRLVRTIPARHRVVRRIRELKVRARDVGDRRVRYGITMPPAPRVTDNAHSGCLPEDGEEDLKRREQLHSEPPPAPADTVGKCGNIVLEWLLEVPPPLQLYRQTIRIEGRGSVGKTSIARRVYQHSSVASSFHRRLWINLGGVNKGMDDLVQEMKEELFPLGARSATSLREELETENQGKTIPEMKRFLLMVLDAAPSDLFTTEQDYFTRLLLHLIERCCFSDDFRTYDLVQLVGPGCALIVTTRYHDEDEESRTLHLHKLNFTLPGFFQPRALALSKCEHPPAILAVLEECYPDVFALQMFLHLLYVNPHRSKAEMDTLSKALGEHKDNKSRIMLMFCYNELPIKYKTCLQYLSIFPQGYIISRTKLIRRWLADGLITNRRISKGSRFVQLDDQAEHVFDALLARGFLRQGETSASGKIKNCTMHHKVHDFIVTDVSFVDACLPPHLAHRFSINSRVVIEEASPPESDGPFHGILSLLDSLPASDQWQLLKVLDLEGSKGLKEQHLKNICKILLLKYLSLRNTDVAQLPKQINKLQCLETLDIRQTEIRAFATKSILLPMLKHLLAGSKVSPRNSDNSHTVRLPSGTRRMKKLEILSHVDASNNVDGLIDIGELLKLRKLGVILNGMKTDSLVLLFQQIEKLHGCLRTLSIQINKPAASETTVSETQQMEALVSPPKFLQSLNINGITSGLPDWITQLDQLTEITLCETYLEEDALHILGMLRILRCLRLRRKSYIGTKLSFNAQEFQHLMSLIVEGNDITNIEFLDIGAAPKLEMIIWTFASLASLPLSGLDLLPRLKKLELNGDGDLVAVRQAVETHPNRPIFMHNSSHQRQEAGTEIAASAPSRIAEFDHQRQEAPTEFAASAPSHITEFEHQRQEAGTEFAASAPSRIREFDHQHQILHA